MAPGPFSVLDAEVTIAEALRLAQQLEAQHDDDVRLNPSEGNRAAPGRSGEVAGHRLQQQLEQLRAIVGHCVTELESYRMHHLLPARSKLAALADVFASVATQLPTVAGPTDAASMAEATGAWGTTSSSSTAAARGLCDALFRDFSSHLGLCEAESTAAVKHVGDMLSRCSAALTMTRRRGDNDDVNNNDHDGEEEARGRRFHPPPLELPVMSTSVGVLTDAAINQASDAVAAETICLRALCDFAWVPDADAWKYLLGSDGPTRISNVFRAVQRALGVELRYLDEEAAHAARAMRLGTFGVSPVCRVMLDGVLSVWTHTVRFIAGVFITNLPSPMIEAGNGRGGGGDDTDGRGPTTTPSGGEGRSFYNTTMEVAAASWYATVALDAVTADERHRRPSPPSRRRRSNDDDDDGAAPSSGKGDDRRRYRHELALVMREWVTFVSRVAEEDQRHAMLERLNGGDSRSRRPYSDVMPAARDMSMLIRARLCSQRHGTATLFDDHQPLSIGRGLDQLPLVRGLLAASRGGGAESCGGGHPSSPPLRPTPPACAKELATLIIAGFLRPDGDLAVEPATLDQLLATLLWLVTKPLLSESMTMTMTPSEEEDAVMGVVTLPQPSGRRHPNSGDPTQSSSAAAALSSCKGETLLTLRLTMRNTSDDHHEDDDHEPDAMAAHREGGSLTLPSWKDTAMTLFFQAALELCEQSIDRHDESQRSSSSHSPSIPSLCGVVVQGGEPCALLYRLPPHPSASAAVAHRFVSLSEVLDQRGSGGDPLEGW